LPPNDHRTPPTSGVPPIPPSSISSRYRWTVLAVGTVGQASQAAVFFGIPVLAPALRDRYDLSLPATGLVLASISVGSLPGLLPWGMLADRRGERLVVGIGLGAAAAALGAAAYAADALTFGALLVVAGFFGASVNAASGRAVYQWFDPGSRGFALGIRQTANVLGGALAALVIPSIAAAGGVRAALLALSGFTLASAAAGTAALRERPENAGSDPPATVRHPLRDPRLWRLSSGSALLLGTGIGVSSFTVLFLHEARGLSAAAGGVVLAAGQLVAALLRIESGRWSDRLGARIAPMRALAFLTVVAVAATIALVEAPLALLVPVLAAAGALAMSWNALSFAAAAELAGHARSGAALGMQQTALAVAAAAVPIVFAALVDATSWRAGFAVAALCALAGWVVLRPLDERRQGDNRH
jgi:sugar phosphate permease